MRLTRTNIIYLYPHFTIPGGAGNVVLESACRLDPEKYNVCIVCIRADQVYKKRYPKLVFIEIGGPLPNSPLFWLTFPWTQFKVQRVLKGLSPQLIFPHVLPANWWAFIFKIFHREVACLWYCHEPSAFIHSRNWIEAISNPLMRVSAKLLNPFLKTIDVYLVSKGADRIVCNSKFTVSLFQNTYRRNIKEVLCPGVDLNFFVPHKTKKKYLFMISRLTRFKNVHVAIEAMATLRHKDYELIIGGEGEEKHLLIALSEKLGLADKIRFIGSVPFKQLPELYGEAKLLLFLSTNEPFGMVPIEALGCGTPVVGANSGGLKETIVHNYNGILLDHLTPGNLQVAIDDLLADSGRYRRLQQHAGKSVEKFAWGRHVKKLEQVFDDLISDGFVKSSVIPTSREYNWK